MSVQALIVVAVLLAPIVSATAIGAEAVTLDLPERPLAVGAPDPATKPAPSPALAAKPGKAPLVDEDLAALVQEQFMLFLKQCGPVVGCDLPYVVDEHGDVMTGQLEMQDNIVMAPNTKIIGANFEAPALVPLELKVNNFTGLEIVELNNTEVGPEAEFLKSNILLKSFGDLNVQQNSIIINGNALNSPFPGALYWNNQPLCLAPDACGGTLYEINTGAGLTGGPITSIGTVSVAPSGIVSSMIADGTIVNADVATGSIDSRAVLDGTLQELDFAFDVANQGELDSLQAAFNAYKLLLSTEGTHNLASNPLDWTQLKNVPVGFGLLLADGVFLIDSTLTQERVTGTCAVGSYLQAVHQDGSVACESLAAGAGLALDGSTYSIPEGGVVSLMLADGTILNIDLATGAIDSRTILDGTILEEDLGFAVADQAELDAVQASLDAHQADIAAPGTLNAAANPLEWTKLKGVPAGAGLAIEGGALRVAEGGVVSLMLADGTILNIDLSTGAVDSRVLLDGTILEEDLGFATATQAELDAAVAAASADLDAFKGHVASPGAFNEGSNPLDWSKVKNVPVGSGLLLSPAGVFAIDSGYTQRRVTGTCTVGSYLQGISEAGAASCESLAAGAGLALDGSTYSIPEGAVLSLMLADGSILNIDLADGSVDSRVLLDGTIVNADIAGGAVDSASILDGSVAEADLAFAVADQAELDAVQANLDAHKADIAAPGTLNAAANPLEWTKLKGVPAGAGLAIEGGALRIAPGGVVTAMLADGSIVNINLATGSVDSRALLDGSIVNADIAPGAVDSASILDGTIGEGDLAFAVADQAELDAVQADLDGFRTGLAAPGTFNAAANPLDWTQLKGVPVGDGLVLAADGTFSIAAGGVATSMLADEAVTGSKVAPAAIASGHVAGAAITTSHLAAGAVTTEKVALAAVTNALLAGDAVESANILDGSVTLADLAFNPATQAELDDFAAQLAAPGTLNAPGNPLEWTQLKNVPPGFADGVDDDTTYSAGSGLAMSGTELSVAPGGVTSAMLASGAVGTAALADGAVTGAKVAAGSIGASHLADGAVGSDALLDGSVAEVDLAFAAATQGELDAVQAGLDALAAPGTLNAAGNPVDWTKLKGVPAGFADGVDADTTYGAGTGLTLAAGVFSVNNNAVQTRVSEGCGPGSSIRLIHEHGQVTCEIDTDTNYYAGPGLSMSGTTLILAQDGVRSEHILDNHVITSKLANGAVTGAKLAAGSVTHSHIMDASIVQRHLANGAVDGPAIADGSITSVDIANGVVNSLNIQNGTLQTEDFANGVVTPEKLAFDPATQAEYDFLGTETPGLGINHAGNPLHWTKLKGVPAGFADGVDDVGVYTAGAGLALSGNELSIAPGGVAGVMLASGAVDSSALAPSSVLGAHILDGEVTPAKLSFAAATQGDLDDLGASLGTPGTINLAGNPLEWTQLKGVPSGLADGVDADTLYTAGGGLSLTGTQFNVDTSAVQTRVAGACATGSSIREIAQDGSVTCEPSGGLAGSGTTGRIPRFVGGGTLGDSVISENAGNIGIATTTPATKLDVAGSARVTSLGVGTLPQGNAPLSVSFSGQGSAGLFGFPPTQGDFWFDGGPDGNFVFRNTGASVGRTAFIGADGTTERLTIMNTGNVGVGVSSPASRLQVAGGNIQLDANRVVGHAPQDSFVYDGKTMGHYSMGWFQDTWSPWGNTAWVSGYGGMKFFTFGQERMVLNQDGNLGIGVSAATHRLTVGGPAKAQSFVADLQGFPAGSECNSSTRGELRVVVDNAAAQDSVLVCVFSSTGYHWMKLQGTFVT